MEQKNSTEQKLEELYQSDKKAFEDFVHSKTSTMDFASLRRGNFRIITEKHNYPDTYLWVFQKTNPADVSIPRAIRKKYFTSDELYVSKVWLYQASY